MPLEELRYISLAAAVLVAILLPFFPRIGVTGLVLLFPLLPRFIPRAGPGINAATALFPLALLAGLLYSRPALPRLKVIAPFLAYYALTLIGYAVLVATTDAKDNAVIVEGLEVMKARLWPSLLFFVGFSLAPDRAIRERLVVCMVIGLVIHAVSGIFDFATGGAGGPQSIVSLTPGEFYRASGVLDANPNILGAHLGAFSILALMGMIRRDYSLALRGLCAGAYAISGVVLVLTQSRGSWLGFLVAHAIWLFYTNRKLMIPAIAALVVIAVAAYTSSMLPKSLTKRIDETFTPGGVQYSRGGIASRFDSSVNARVAVHLTAAAIFVDSPIWGHGFASFRKLALEYGATHGLWGLEGVSSESIILNTAVEGGVIGLLIYGWLFWVMLVPAWKLMRSREEGLLGVGLLTVFGAIFIESLTQIALFLPEVSQGVWLMAGMAARAQDQVERAGGVP